MSLLTSTSSELDTIPKRLKYMSETWPDRELMVFYDGGNRQAYTALELYTLAGRFANRLRQNGFKRHDVIANTLPNSPERAVTDLGIFMAGCVMMHGQVLLSDGTDLFRNTRVSRCKGVIVSDDVTSSAWKLLEPYITEPSDTLFEKFTYHDAPCLTSAIVISRQSRGDKKPLLERFKQSEEDICVEAVSPGDLAAMFCTSGSTGCSKLVPRSHEDIIRVYVKFANDNFVGNGEPYTSILIPGWFGGFPGSAYCCGTTRILSDDYSLQGKLSASDILDMNLAEKCQILKLQPVQVQAIEEFSRSNGGLTCKLKCLQVGGQQVTKRQVRSMLQISERVHITYASTETSVISSCMAEEETCEDYKCGKLVKGVQLRIVDEEGRQCAPRELGNIYVKGEDVFKGYYNRLEDPDTIKAKAFTRDNWFITEDFGYLDEDENLFVLGRNKDAIIYGSVVFQPVWLENKLKEHPDVAEAILVPVSDPLTYHNICACILPRAESNLTEDDIKAYCESIVLPDLGYVPPNPGYYMILKKSFPWTTNSKPDKQKLRKMAEDAFGYIGKDAV
ncbi:unnamed protein product [Lymnaea stagnalis]|uniref:Uncharacterized protein n=1 Tax=Lymnaea stagnalis TaxID=6523 RepID=A0AAV2IE39_LYMST